MLFKEGTGFWVPVTVKLTAELVPPPGLGLVTVTLRAPAAAPEDTEKVAVSWVALT